MRLSLIHIEMCIRDSYTTYDNRQITGVKLHAADLDSAQLTAYPLADTQQIRWEN